MTIDPALSGRLGHLTEEEEAKLREFWSLLLKIFKVGDEEGKDSFDNAMSLQRTISTSVSANDNASVTTEKKKTKKRFGFFGRYTETVEEKEETAAISNHSVANQIKLSDEDDKYGLNKEFFAALASQSPEELRTTFWNAIKHDHPDALLLRFLRARKWDVHKALVMLVSTLKWRHKEWNVDEDIVLRGESAVHENAKSDDPVKRKEGQDMIQMLRVGEAYCRGKDKEGRPICYIRVKRHRIGAYCQSGIEKNIIFQIETSRLMLDAKTETAMIVFDMTDFGLANMDYIPVKFIIKCFEANYPESLGAVLVHKAPWIFSSFWSIIKGWLDPVVASKVHFTANHEELENYIANDSIPKDLGGNDDYEYEYIEPQEGENDLLKDTAKANELKEQRHKIIDELQKQTLTWINSASTATDKGEEIKKQRQETAEKLGEFYWTLDPYIRARSIYDRIKEAEEAAAAAAAPKVEEAKATETAPAAVKEPEKAPVSEKQDAADALKPQTQVVEVQTAAAS
ncbi:hypothetical protein AJ79_05480 [Helicocarpus griseus UAMH5409]|uniref:CRAL-TRIO domain-containing protein n=1 Tax=Helicocarpus griseus UAMH5409 TaxID=1447875 RepID=A0A2B7XMR7_9EURO|nr:hypothetical protein AJ79_05480 [Helicocarpus griseus UAMH5409]